MIWGHLVKDYHSIKIESLIFLKQVQELKNNLLNLLSGQEGQMTLLLVIGLLN